MKCTYNHRYLNQIMIILCIWIYSFKNVINQTVRQKNTKELGPIKLTLVKTGSWI